MVGIRRVSHPSFTQHGGDECELWLRRHISVLDVRQPSVKVRHDMKRMNRFHSAQHNLLKYCYTGVFSVCSSSCFCVAVRRHEASREEENAVRSLWSLFLPGYACADSWLELNSLPASCYIYTRIFKSLAAKRFRYLSTRTHGKVYTQASRGPSTYSYISVYNNHKIAFIESGTCWQHIFAAGVSLHPYQEWGGPPYPTRLQGALPQNMEP